MRWAPARSRPLWRRILGAFSNAWMKVMAGGPVDFGFGHHSLPVAVVNTARHRPLRVRPPKY
jgi:hypothetical protein